MWHSNDERAIHNIKDVTMGPSPSELQLCVTHVMLWMP